MNPANRPVKAFWIQKKDCNENHENASNPKDPDLDKFKARSRNAYRGRSSNTSRHPPSLQKPIEGTSDIRNNSVNTSNKRHHQSYNSKNKFSYKRTQCRSQSVEASNSNENRYQNLEKYDETKIHCSNVSKQSMSFKEIQNLINKQPTEILFLLNCENFFNLIENQELKRELLASILISIGKASSSDRYSNVASLINNIASSKTFFPIHIPRYLARLQMVDPNEMYFQSVVYLTKFLHKYQNVIPASASECILILHPLLVSTCKRMLKNTSYFPEISKLLEEIEEENEKFLKSFSEVEIKRASQKEKLQEKNPPENYRSIPTLPTIDDMQQTSTFLRPNLVTGKYRDVDHYLDVQYRLLREDYVKPLRDGICDFLRLKRSGKSVKNCRDVRVYCDVYIIKQELAHGGLVHIAHFEEKNFAKIRWEFSKRFLTGSLLCLSSDDFKTLLFATVAKRDAKELNKGNLLLRFEELTDEVLTIDPLRKFDVLETTAYFEAYRHNLDALHGLDENNLPMKRYIIDVEKKVNHPQYMNNSTTYDMRPLLLPMDTECVKHDNLGHSFHSRYEFPKEISDKAGFVNVLNDKCWPSCNELSLDQTQYDALKAAITKEFAVIQGPPGTGKTFVGLRIAQLLLHNIGKWQTEATHSPILVVCYTNHALDQFLEGILLFTKNIVRIGGRGINEEISKYQLNNLKREIQEKRNVPTHIFQGLRRKNYDLKSVKLEIESIQKFLRQSLTNVLSENILCQHIPNQHYQSLKMAATYYDDDDRLIFDWLGTRVRPPKLEASSNMNPHDEEFQRYSDELKKSQKKSEHQNEIDNEPLDNEESEEEADVEYIEAMRDIDSEEFADISFDILEENNFEAEPMIASDGWQIQGGKKAIQKYIKHYTRNNKPMTEINAKKITNIWSLSLPERWQLYMYWVKEYSKSKEEESFELQKQLREEYKVMQEMRNEEDLYVCKNAYVVGMTTTGAAKYRNVLQHLDPKIVIVEEAAEVLESHIVTSLTAGTQHVILIGDHQQLRPSPTVHELAVRYDLDVSLFERMVKNDLECYRLGLQHRMRPEIAALLVPHIYKDLKNHESVTQYEHIVGVNKSVFFINHSVEESSESDSKSKVNDHEVGFLVRLCKYLILQGYEKSKITILATYSGQLFALKRRIGKQNFLEGVKVTVVDNFQGEENDIILISFVRSNEEGNIGFLKISNRVCVALSRAKKGLFCIGNFDLLASKSDLWKNIFSTLGKNEMIGHSLQLICQNHPEVSNVVSNEKDFDSVPEGGCSRSCESRLTCGHVCPKLCHPYDREHLKIDCQKPCPKKCELGHQCESKCFKKCPPCIYPMEKIIDSCGHSIKIPCSSRNKVVTCTQKCDRLLNCGHQCAKICNESCTVKCEKKVVIVSSVCGHNVNISCFNASNMEYLQKICSNKCGVLLSCGHLCTGTCGKCFQGRLHVKCNALCKRILVCGHECKSRCSKSCPPCNRPCENRCFHSKCPKKCGEPCDTCSEPCQWICSHMMCKNLCGQECTRLPCLKPCVKNLTCGHQCIGLCGEPCPKQCRICDESEVKEIFFGSEDEEDASFIYLEDCKHIFEINGIKQWMQQNTSNNGEIQMRYCPRCKTVIRRNLYFANIVKSCIADIEKVKMVTFGDAKNNSILQKKLFNDLERMTMGRSLSFYKPLLSTLSADKGRSIQELTIIENMITITGSLLLHLDIINLRNNFPTNKKLEEILHTLSSFAELTQKVLFNFIRDEYLTASEQQLDDLSWEAHRLSLAGTLLRTLHERKPVINSSSQVNLDDLLRCVINQHPFRDEHAKIFAAHFQLFKQQLGGAVINVSELEQKSILKAMGLSSGHWYQCPNGHVYCITECGGAMQKSTCNECGAEIGGTNHQLLGSNRVATAMDGSRHGAWSDAMNMQNYEL